MMSIDKDRMKIIMATALKARRDAKAKDYQYPLLWTDDEIDNIAGEHCGKFLENSLPKDFLKLLKEVETLLWSIEYDRIYFMTDTKAGVQMFKERNPKGYAEFVKSETFLSTPLKQEARHAR